MRRYCKEIDITDLKFIFSAIITFLKGKTSRKKIASFFSKLTGYEENDITFSLKEKDELYYHCIKIAANKIRQDILDKNIELTPIKTYNRVDKSNHKIRKIGIQSVYQSILDHIIVKAFKESGLSNAIGEQQCASIPKRGCVKGAKIIANWLLNKEIKYYVKLDIKKCYDNIKIDRMIEFYNRKIKNPKLLWLIETVLKNHGENLSIGSYLSQWSCNLYLSQLWHYLGNNCHKKRRGKKIKIIHHKLFYMDDILFLGSNKKYLAKASIMAQNYLKTLGLEIKPWEVKKIGESGVDMMGFRCHRGFNTIRRTIFKRVRRAFIRASKEYAKYKTLKMTTARKIISYNSFLKNSKSSFCTKKYSVKFLIKRAAELIGCDYLYSIASENEETNMLKDMSLEEFKRWVGYKD